MKKYLIYDNNTKRYYNFISRKWSKFFTYGCLADMLECQRAIESFPVMMEFAIIDCYVEQTAFEKFNQVVDEVIAF